MQHYSLAAQTASFLTFVRKKWSGQMVDAMLRIHVTKLGVKLLKSAINVIKYITCGGNLPRGLNMECCLCAAFGLLCRSFHHYLSRRNRNENSRAYPLALFPVRMSKKKAIWAATNLLSRSQTLFVAGRLSIRDYKSGRL